MNWIFDLDHRLFLWMNRFNDREWLNYLLGWPTVLGRLEVLLGVVFCVMWISRQKGWMKDYLAFALVVTIVYLFAGGLKLAFMRPRPYDFFPPEIVIRTLFARPDTYSFPSGHSAAAFAAAVLLHFFYGRAARFVYPAAFIVAISRIFIGVHYPSDVAAGAFIGILGGWLGVWILKHSDPGRLSKR